MHDLIERQAAIDAICEDGTQLERQGQYSMTMAERKQRDADILDALPSAQPEHTNSCYTNSWCIDCKEYDTENKCCPRYNRVIKQTLDEVYAHAETEAEARYHAERKKGKWINVRHDNIAECDQCGITGRAWMNFCFDCGADMRGEQDE